MRKRDPLPLIPFLALLVAGWAGAGMEVCIYCVIGVVVLVLICDPFRLLGRWLSPQLRWGGALTICMALAALRLPGLALYSRVCALLISVVVVALLLLKNQEWHLDWQVRQSPDVDRILSHLTGGGSFEASDAWESYGCREARAMLHQTIGVECPEPLLESHYRPVYLLGYLHGLQRTQREREAAAKAEKEVQRLSDDLFDLRREYERLEQQNSEQIQEILNQRQSADAGWMQVKRLKNQLAEAEMELNQLAGIEAPEPETPPTEAQEAPQSRREKIAARDAELLAYAEEGHSIAEVGLRFGLKKSTAAAALQRARAAKEQAKVLA